MFDVYYITSETIIFNCNNKDIIVDLSINININI